VGSECTMKRKLMGEEEEEEMCRKTCTAVEF
jgi:hypothetical protein